MSSSRMPITASSVMPAPATTKRPPSKRGTCPCSSFPPTSRTDSEGNYSIWASGGRPDLHTRSINCGVLRSCKPMTGNCALFKRLEADQVAVVVHVPDRDGIRGVVDPGAAVVGIRLGHHVAGPLVSLRVEPHEVARLQAAGPDFAVFVRHGFVEGFIGNRGVVERGSARLGVELDQHAAAPAEPGIAHRIETASGSARDLRAGFEF